MKFVVSDFMADTLFHGLKSLYGDAVVDVHDQWHMYEDADRSITYGFHGRGFTLCGNLPRTKIDRTDIESKIKNKYFDLVVYGAVYRNLDYLDLVLQNYKRNQIVFMDGHEIIDMNWSPINLVEKGTYFKMTMDNNVPNVFPAYLTMPKEKFCKNDVNKEKLIATNIPGIVETLIFDNEKSYYEDHQKSLFGYTWKKACWESLRHGELVINKCIPLFIDIKHCPSQQLQKLPKKLLLDAFDLFKNLDQSFLDKEFVYDRNRIMNFDLNMFNDLDIDFDRYSELNDKLHTYWCENLTTEHIAKYVIEKTI